MLNKSDKNMTEMRSGGKGRTLVLPAKSKVFFLLFFRLVFCLVFGFRLSFRSTASCTTIYIYIYIYILSSMFFFFFFSLSLSLFVLVAQLIFQLPVSVCDCFFDRTSFAHDYTL